MKAIDYQKRSENRSSKVKIKFRHRHPILFYSTIGFLVAFVFGAVSVMSYVNKVISQTPMITEAHLKSESTSNMYDVHGRKIWSDMETMRDYILISDIPQSYIDLLLSVEDSTFYEDKGVSKRGVFNAFYTTAMSKINPSVEARGGSSIDQQLLKNASDELANQPTIERKLMEWWRAYQMNENFTKDQILEYYINKIYLGEHSYGAETIALTYYGVSLKDLAEPTPQNLSKLAIIAGLGQSPSSYNLYDNPENVSKRRSAVLISAVNNGKLTEAQRKEIEKIDVTEGLKERHWRNTEIQNTVKAYNSYIDSTLKQLVELGYDYKKTPIQIYTHLDSSQQDWLNSQVNDPIYYANDGQQIAVTVVDPQSGVVIAQSGGRNEEAYGLNRATQQVRSSGSSTKPFISYGPAIEYFGYGSNSIFDSSNYVYPGTSTVASNFGGYQYGNVTMTYALKMSLNTPAIRLLDNVVGTTYSKDFLSKLGLDVKDTYGASDALGINVSTSQEASAFAAIANKGKYKRPQYIKSLTFSDGSSKEINYDFSQGMKESTSYILAKMLEQTLEQGGSADKAKINEFAGHFVKTGTVGYDMSDGIWRPNFAASDMWISGSTKSAAVSIWTGYDKPNEPGNWLEIENRGYMQLYVNIMKHYNEGKDTSGFEQPSTVSGSGLILSPIDVQSTENALRPNLPLQIATSELFDIDPTKQFKFNVKRDELAHKIPEDYKYQSWVDSLSDDDKKVYEKWKDRNDYKPTYSDVVDEKEFYDNSRIR